MSGVVAALVGTNMVTLSGQTIHDLAGSSAELTVDSDGNVYELTASGGSAAQIDSATDWLRPAIGMSNYYVRATINSGSLAAGTTGSWLQLNSDRTWAVSGSGAGADLTIEIAADAAGTIILASNTYILTTA
jgi:hypothetical protein